LVPPAKTVTLTWLSVPGYWCTQGVRNLQPSRILPTSLSVMPDGPSVMISKPDTHPVLELTETRTGPGVVVRATDVVAGNLAAPPDEGREETADSTPAATTNTTTRATAATRAPHRSRRLMTILTRACARPKPSSEVLSKRSRPLPPLGPSGS